MYGKYLITYFIETNKKTLLNFFKNYRRDLKNLSKDRENK